VTPRSGLTLGMDLGGTRVKAGAVSPDGAIVARRVEAVGDVRDEEAIVARLAGLAAALDPGGAAPIGVAAAGVVDQREGTLRQSPNFPSWRDFALAARLAAATGRRVTLENDANAVIFGEVIAGAGRGERCVFGYTLGTGVGGAIVLDGELWRGSRGMAGELGHVTVVRGPDARPCGCGNRGCLEQYAGAVGLRATLAGSGRPLADLAGDPDAPARLARLAEQGDERALAIYADLGVHLGVAAAAMVHALDVTTIILAGGIAYAAGLFVPAMEAEIRARTFVSMSEGLSVRAGTLGEDAGIVGAAMAASSGDATLHREG